MASITLRLLEAFHLISGFEHTFHVHIAPPWWDNLHLSTFVLFALMLQFLSSTWCPMFLSIEHAMDKIKALCVQIKEASRRARAYPKIWKRQARQALAKLVHW